jgi:hypothetical protein
MILALATLLICTAMVFIYLIIRGEERRLSKRYKDDA